VGTNIVDDLCYSGNFTSSKNPDIDTTHNVPYVERAYDYSDELHTHRKEQYLFCGQDTVDTLEGFGSDE